MIEFVSFACAGYVDASYQYDNASFQLGNLYSTDDDDRDVIGSSQLRSTTYTVTGPCLLDTRAYRAPCTTDGPCVPSDLPHGPFARTAEG